MSPERRRQLHIKWGIFYRTNDLGSQKEKNIYIYIDIYIINV